MCPISAKLNGERQSPSAWTRHLLAGVLAATMLLSGCALMGSGKGAPRMVARVLGPEAIAMTPQGRVFVTGRVGAYELVDARAEASLEPLEITAEIPAGCQFTGADTTTTWLFVLCTVGDGSYLLRGRIGTGTPVLNRVAYLPGIAIASGLTIDDEGRLYIADSRHGGEAITRVTGALGDAFQLQSTAWLDSTRGGFPNGLQFARGTLYLTSAGRLSAIKLDADGQPGEITPITTRLTFLDDFQVLRDGHFLLTDYSFNRLLLLSPAGIELGAFGHGTKGPTDVALLPMTGDDDKPMVLISERDGERISRVAVPGPVWRRLKTEASPARPGQ